MHAIACTGYDLISKWEYGMRECGYDSSYWISTKTHALRELPWKKGYSRNFEASVIYGMLTEVCAREAYLK